MSFDRRFTRRGSLTRMGTLVAVGVYSGFGAGASSRTFAALREASEPRHANDSIFVNGGKRSLLVLRRSGSGWTGSITMGGHRG